LEKNRLVLDSGALSVVAGENGRLRLAIRQALAQSTDVVVPTVVVAESTTGHVGHDARVNHALKSTQPTRGHGRCNRCGDADCVPGSQLLTGDTSDVRPLAAVANKTVVVSINA